MLGLGLVGLEELLTPPPLRPLHSSCLGLIWTWVWSCLVHLGTTQLQLFSCDMTSSWQSLLDDLNLPCLCEACPCSPCFSFTLAFGAHFELMFSINHCDSQKRKSCYMDGISKFHQAEQILRVRHQWSNLMLLYFHIGIYSNGIRSLQSVSRKRFEFPFGKWMNLLVITWPITFSRRLGQDARSSSFLLVFCHRPD